MFHSSFIVKMLLQRRRRKKARWSPSISASVLMSPWGLGVSHSIDSVFLTCSDRWCHRAYLLTGHACRCVATISFAGMHFGKSEWELMSLAASEWACGEGSLIPSFSTVHLQSTWLSPFFFFPLNRRLAASPQDLPAVCVLWLQNASKRERRPLSAACDPVAVTAAGPPRAGGESFMTRAFGKHQIVACQHQIRA